MSDVSGRLKDASGTAKDKADETVESMRSGTVKAVDQAADTMRSKTAEAMEAGMEAVDQVRVRVDADPGHERDLSGRIVDAEPAALEPAAVAVLDVVEGRLDLLERVLVEPRDRHYSGSEITVCGM